MNKYKTLSKVHLLTVALLGILLLVGFLVQLNPQDLETGELKFQLLEDQKLAETAFTGAPLLVQFWSTTCVVCLREMPDLGKLYEKYHPNGLQMVAVAMPTDPPNRVMEFQSRLRPPFPIALDPTQSIYRAFGSPRATPTFFLLDAGGQVVAHHIGGLRSGVIAKEIATLLKLPT